MTEKGLMVPNEDYVVVPLPVRDRIMQRLNAAEERVKELEVHPLAVTNCSTCRGLRALFAELRRRLVAYRKAIVWLTYNSPYMTAPDEVTKAIDRACAEEKEAK
jgi:hypothetical protein